jgi:hypothetical protein
LGVKTAQVIEVATVQVGGTPTFRAGAEEVLLSRKQAALRYQTTQPTLIRWERTGLLKALRLGNLVRYRLRDLIAFEKSAENARIPGKRTPKQQPAEEVQS